MIESGGQANICKNCQERGCREVSLKRCKEPCMVYVCEVGVRCVDDDEWSISCPKYNPIESGEEPEWLSKKPLMSKEEYDELVRKMLSPEHVKILAQTALYYADAEMYSLEEDKQ